MCLSCCFAHKNVFQTPKLWRLSKQRCTLRIVTCSTSIHASIPTNQREDIRKFHWVLWSSATSAHLGGAPGTSLPKMCPVFIIRVFPSVWLSSCSFQMALLISNSLQNSLVCGGVGGGKFIWFFVGESFRHISKCNILNFAHESKFSLCTDNVVPQLARRNQPQSPAEDCDVTENDHSKLFVHCLTATCPLHSEADF